MAVALDQNLFEKVLIWNSLNDASYLETIIEYVKPSFIEDEKLRSIYGNLLGYYNEYKKVPNITELKMHTVDPEHRTNLKSVITNLFKTIDHTYDRDVLLKITENFIKRKTVLQTVQRTSVDIQAGDIDTEKILKDFEKACSISLIDNLGFDYLENIDKHCDDLLKTFETISTGWSWLDEQLGGGFQKEGKSMVLFYGPTNSGKSIFLGNIATNVLAQNKTVILITLEMPETVYCKRISAQLSKIPFNHLKDNIEPLKGHLKGFKLKHGDAKLIVKEFPPKSVTVNHIKAFIRRLIKKGIKPELIVLDYLTLLAASTVGVKSYEAFKEIAEEIRALTYEFGCTIVSAVQTNRQGYNTPNPGLETTGESMGISHTVDAQISIWTEDDDIDLGIIHYAMTKNRYGPKDCASVLEIDYPTLSLRDPDDVAMGYITKPKDDITKIIDINKKDKTIRSTLDIIESLGKDDDD